MKRLLADVTYESVANEHGWRTKYFTPRIVEVDFEGERASDMANGFYVGDLKMKGILSSMKANVDVGGWRCRVVKVQSPKSKEHPVKWLLRQAIKYRVFNLEATKKLCATGSILNVLPEEHQMAYQFGY